jgi:DUF4097 and DUF4098 domain-containing protein YvlB
MPTFETPEPISVTLDLSVGFVRIAASDRTDTVVEVRPSDEADEADVQEARQIRVDYANGTLRVTGPRHRWDFSRKVRSVDVSIELPTGSRVSAAVVAGDIRCDGTLGEGKLKTSAGGVWLERTAALGPGTPGNVEASTGTGKIQIGEVAGTAIVKNSNGDTTIDAVGGDVRVRAANGDIHVGRAGGGVDAKTANGAIHLGEVVRGSVVLGSSNGDLEVGIARGTAAWLEVNTGFGHVRNQMESAPGPEESAERVEVRAHTSFGDITVHHA